MHGGHCTGIHMKFMLLLLLALLLTTVRLHGCSTSPCSFSPPSHAMFYVWQENPSASAALNCWQQNSMHWSVLHRSKPWLINGLVKHSAIIKKSAHFHCMRIAIVVGDTTPMVQPMDLWLPGQGVLVGFGCPDIWDMISLVFLRVVIKDSNKTRSELLYDGQVMRLISFCDANILKDLRWEPPVGAVEL